jgi:hypothetical protein
MSQFSYSLDEATAFVSACRTEMRRLGKSPVSRCDCVLVGPFRS